MRHEPRQTGLPIDRTLALRGVTTWGLVALMGAVWFSAPAAVAQLYKTEPIDRTFERKGATVKRFVKAGGDAEARKTYENYFMRYFFPAMKQSAPDDLGTVGELRYDLFKNYLWQAQPELQRDLTRRAYFYARGVLKKHREYHPTVGYNALLVLGGLDAEYGSDGRNNRRPPKPLAAANRLLCEIVSACVEGRAPLRLETGALVGLERHARYIGNLPAEAQQKTAKTLRMVATQTKFPEGTEKEVQAWVRRQACRGIANLAGLGTPGIKREVAKMLLPVIADKTLPLATRCEVAGMLGGLDLNGVPGVDFAGGYATLRELAAVVAADARETATKYNEYQLGRNQRALKNLIDPMRFFFDEDDEIAIERRPLAANQMQLRDAMRAMGAVAGDQAGEVERYREAFNQAFAVTSTSREQTDDFDVVESLKRMADEIDTLTPAEAPGSETASAEGPAGVDTADNRGDGTSRR